MKLNGFQWVGVVLLLVALGLLAYKHFYLPSHPATPPAATQPAR